MYSANITDAWEDVSRTGNEMMVLEWSYWSGDSHVGEVRQYLLSKIPASVVLLRRLLRTAGRTYEGPHSLVGLSAHIDVDDSGEWPSVTEVRL